MSKIKKETFINEKRPHESGIKHVSGRAFYTDDLPEINQKKLIGIYV